MRRIAQAIAAIVVVLGVFWAGRESSHGLGAFSDHWWCPIPLVMVVLGLLALVALGHRPEAV
jgi:hypothetical protein